MYSEYQTQRLSAMSRMLSCLMVGLAASTAVEGVELNSEPPSGVLRVSGTSPELRFSDICILSLNRTAPHLETACDIVAGGASLLSLAAENVQLRASLLSLAAENGQLGAEVSAMTAELADVKRQLQTIAQIVAPFTPQPPQPPLPPPMLPPSLPPGPPPSPPPPNFFTSPPCARGNEYINLEVVGVRAACTAWCAARNASYHTVSYNGNGGSPSAARSTAGPRRLTSSGSWTAGVRRAPRWNA